MTCASVLCKFRSGSMNMIVCAHGGRTQALESQSHFHVFDCSGFKRFSPLSKEEGLAISIASSHVSVIRSISWMLPRRRRGLAATCTLPLRIACRY